MKVTNGNNPVGLHNITSFGMFNVLAVRLSCSQKKYTIYAAVNISIS